MLLPLATCFALLSVAEGARLFGPWGVPTSNYNPLKARQLPAEPVGVKTITTPQNLTIRYKEPGKDGVCETTPGVNSYSGYVDLDENAHTFFWFIEARHDAKNAPITIWLQGGPGSDSLFGLFEENGPCKVTPNLTTVLNPYSWNEYSNMLYLSQPLGVGFSYSQKIEGSHDPYTYDIRDSSYGPVTGRWPLVNATAYDTSDLAAVAAWHVVQGFMSGLSELGSNATSKHVKIYAESYGGHFGPAFYKYFYGQNELIKSGTMPGVALTLDTLGIGNGRINEVLQQPLFPEFATSNTYGIQMYNSTVYNYAKFALNMGNGCLFQLQRYCLPTRLNTSISEIEACVEATDMCRDNVELIAYYEGTRDLYDIRRAPNDYPYQYSYDFLLLDSTMNSLGVDLNYTDSNSEVYRAFIMSGEWAWRSYKQDIEFLLNQGVRVNLYHGDADFICNWFGGEAVSLALNWTHQADFAAAGYAPFIVNGTERGAVRQYANLSFLRIYDCGHYVPYFQPAIAQEMFRRVQFGLDLATGTVNITGDYSSGGNAHATHTEPFVALSTSTSTSTDTDTRTKTRKSKANFHDMKRTAMAIPAEPTP